MKYPKIPAVISRKKPARPHAYPFEFRLRVVRLDLEEGCSRPLLAEQFGISTHSIQRWVKAYREHGATGLHPKPRSVVSGRRVPEQVRERIVEVKASHPHFGPRRIADVLKRFFFLCTSPSTAHRTLAARGLTQKNETDKACKESYIHVTSRPWGCLDYRSDYLGGWRYGRDRDI